MDVRLCSKEDFDQILINIEDFWGSKRTLHLHHPSLIYEFGNTAFVIKQNNIVAAYLFGYISQCEPAGYIHLTAVRKDFQRKGYGKILHNKFIETAKNKGCKFIKAITSISNIASINFHCNLGMQLTGSDIKDGIRFVKDYSGPGEDRVVFIKHI